MISYTWTNEDFYGDLLPNAIYYVLITVPAYDDVNFFIKEQYESVEDFEAAYPDLEHDFWIYDHELDNYNDYELNFHLSNEVQNAHTLDEIFNYYEENTVPYKDIDKNPTKYEGVHAAYRGEVIEIHEMVDEEELARTNSILRLAVDGDLDQIILVLHQTTNGMEDVYEGDEITVYGNLTGSLTYESTAGYNITIPSLEAIIYLK